MFRRSEEHKSNKTLFKAKSVEFDISYYIKLRFVEEMTN